MSVLLLAATLAATAAPVGTHPSTWWDETVYTETGRPVWFRVHYPATSDQYGSDADPTSGPYPVVLWFHGYLGQAWMYQTVADAVASKGFVVINMDVEITTFMDPYVLGELGLFALEAVEGWSVEPGHWMEGMTDGGALTVIAHSMGGIAMAHAVDLEPRISTVIGFSPYRDDDHQWDAYRDFGGAALLLTGDEDETSPPEMVRGEWFDDLDAPGRGVYGVMLGTGHQAVTDVEFEEAALTDAEQLEVSTTVAAAFLDAQVTGDEDAWDALLCTPPTPWDALASQSHDVVTSAAIASDSLVRLGLAGAGAREAVIYLSTAPGETETEHGTIALHEAVVATRVALPDGAGCQDLTLDEDVAGQAWVQVALVGEDDVQLGRVIDLFGTGATTPDDDPDEEEPEDTGPGTDDAPGDTGPHDDTDDTGPRGRSPAASGAREMGGCACSASGAALPATLALLPALVVARRRRRA